MKNNLFYRILLSYTPIFFVVISALIVITFAKINTESQNQIGQTNKVLAGHISRIIDSSLKSTEYIIINELLTNENIALFYNVNADNEPYLIYEISKKLNEISAIYPYLSDVYVYNAAADLIITRNTVYKLDQFLDRPFIEQVQQQPPPFRWSAPRTYIEFQSSANVVTLVQKIPLTFNNQGIIVANVQTNNIRKMIRESTDTELNHVILLNDKDEPFFNQDIASMSDIAVAREKSEYTGWTTVAGLNDSAPMQFLSIFSDTWTIFGIITIIIGIAWLTFVTHRNNKPIELIINKINSHTFQKNKRPGKSKPEAFNFILTSLDTLIEKSTDFERRHKDDLIYRRKLFLQELIDGTRVLSDEQWKAEMERLNLPNDYISLAVSVVEIDKYAAFIANFSQRDQQLFKYVVSNVIDEVSANTSMHIYGEWREANQYCCICLLNEHHQHGQDALTEIFDKLRLWIMHHLQFTITVGIGTEVRSAADIALSYDKAYEALNYKSSLGSNRIIGHWEIAAAAGSDIYPFMQLTQTLVQQLKMDDGWEALLAEVFSRLRERLFSREETQNILNYMVFQLQREIQKIEETSPAIMISDLIEEMSRAVEYIDTLEETQSQLTQLFAKIHDRLLDWREENSNHHLIVKIKAYITDHYGSQDLSLQHLSDKFGLSPRYVSRLFRDVYGEKFVDYMTSIRMIKAKELLLQSNRSVQEIAESVGYTSDISFIRTFKRIVGQTPGEFRRLDG